VALAIKAGVSYDVETGSNGLPPMLSRNATEHGQRFEEATPRLSPTTAPLTDQDTTWIKKPRSSRNSTKFHIESAPNYYYLATRHLPGYRDMM